MHIGLIGGIGPAATVFHDRRLISTFAARKATLDLTIVHADTPILLTNLAAGNTAAQVAIYKRLTDRLAAAGAEIMPPIGADLDDVHAAYVAMAASGVITNAQREVFLAAGQKLISAAGAEAIMLGGTDLALAFDAANPPFPLIDCAAIHADTIADLATR